MKICDLHTHSIFSDGTCSPEQLLELAKQANLSAVALTDHNTINGLEQFVKAGKKYGVETVAGIEISSVYSEIELHIVALCIDERCYSRINEFLAIPKQRKEQSNQLLASRLCEKGYLVDYQEIKKQSTGLPNRVHFAQALMEKGYISSIKEGFDTLLKEGNGIYVPPERLTAFEVISFIKSINAVSVLAHPLLCLSKEQLVEFLAQATTFGLNAMEVRYSKYSDEDVAFSEKIAKEFGLLASGGSDFHGQNKPTIKIGVGEGNLNVPYEFLEKIKACKT